MARASPRSQCPDAARRGGGAEAAGFFFMWDGRGDFFDVPKWTNGFFTYYGFLTITSSNRIISRDFVQC
jgi:hypothetical protein